MADVFISYRRKRGGAYAKLLQTTLQQEYGLTVFLDDTNLRNGRYDDALINAIDASPDFVLLLTPGALDFENDEGRVFLDEIERAIDAHKNIIPLMLEDFAFPATLPKKLADFGLDKLQGVEAKDVTLFTRYLIPRLIDYLTPNERLSACTANSVLSSRRAIEATRSLAEAWRGANSVDICAFANQAVFTTERIALAALLASPGNRFRMVINRPDSDAALEAAKMKIDGGSLAFRRRIIPNAATDAYDWLDEHRDGSFEYRTTDWYLPCAIMIVKYPDPFQDNIKVDYYSFSVVDKERRSIMIYRKSDPENFTFYEKQFEIIWSGATPVALAPGEDAHA